MQVINFFGEPSAGKSTSSLGLTYIMKKRGYKVEYVGEYAKEVIYDGSPHLLSYQNFIFANQEYRLSRLFDKVDYVVTDSPLLNSIIYKPENYYENFDDFCYSVFSSFDNINIFIKRNHAYTTDGRVQTEAEAEKIGKRIVDVLANYSENYYSYIAGDNTPDLIFDYLIENNLLKIK